MAEERNDREKKEQGPSILKRLVDAGTDPPWANAPEHDQTNLHTAYTMLSRQLVWRHSACGMVASAGHVIVSACREKLVAVYTWD